jgi:methanogenic corrinoid protein MtbC1
MVIGYHPTSESDAPFRELRDDLVKALMALDGNRADRIVEEALALTNLENVCLYVLQGAMVEIGSRWEHGTANVAIEHHAASYVQRKFGALFNQSNPNEGRGPIVAACPEGEQHDIGLLLTCLFLSRRGYRIIYLGANMPLADLVDTVRRVQPPLVLLSATREDTARRVADAIGPLKRAVDDINERDLPEIGYGGHIFAHRPELRHAIDGVFLGVDAKAAIESVDRIFASISV